MTVQSAEPVMRLVSSRYTAVTLRVCVCGGGTNSENWQPTAHQQPNEWLEKANPFMWSFNKLIHSPDKKMMVMKKNWRVSGEGRSRERV